MARIPTIEIVNEEGRKIKINERDVASYCEQGWNVVSEGVEQVETADQLEAEEAAGDEEVEKTKEVSDGEGSAV